MTEPDELRWVSCDGGHAVAVRRGVLITIWSGEMRAASVRAAGLEARRLTDLQPGGLSFLNMVVRGTPVPSEEVRAEFQRMIRQGPGALRCTAIVAEGGGFHGSVVRAVVTGIVMAVRPTFPMKVHGSVADAAAWIAQQAGQGGATASEITGAVDAMRAKIAAQA